MPDDWPDWTSGTVSVASRSGVMQAGGYNQLTTDTVLATPESILISSGVITLAALPAVVWIIAWFQILLGVAAGGGADRHPLIRRGPLITDPIVGTANREFLQVAGSQTYGELIQTADTIASGSTVQYSVSYANADTVADTVVQAAIFVVLV